MTKVEQVIEITDVKHCGCGGNLAMVQRREGIIRVWRVECDYCGKQSGSGLTKDHAINNWYSGITIPNNLHTCPVCSSKDVYESMSAGGYECGSCGFNACKRHWRLLIDKLNEAKNER